MSENLPNNSFKRSTASLSFRYILMRPGEELIEQGIKDLADGQETIPALSCVIGAPRLRRLGLAVPQSTIPSPEHRLLTTN